MNRSSRNRTSTTVASVSRRGMTAYYMVALMVVFCGFASFAVDLGRVQLVKTELRRAADTSARAAVAVLPNVTLATSNAVSFASMNKADEQPVALDANADVEFGTWNATAKSFTVLTGSARTNANAVRVTARRTSARGNATPLLFAKVLGAQTCDTSASAIAMLNPSRPAPGVVGINSFRMNGGDIVDSYDSRLGSYSSQTPDDEVGVASNGSISLNGSGVIKGDVYFGSTVSAPSGAISGTQIPLTATLSYPAPTLPATYTSHGNVSLGGGQSLTLPGGNHVVGNLRMSGSSVLNVTGAVKLYVTGSFEMDGNSSITLAGNKPADLEIYVIGSGAVTLSKNDLYAVLYAPQSTVTMNGNCDLYGSIIAGSIVMGGNNTIHYDESLAGAPVGPGTVVLVK